MQSKHRAGSGHRRDEPSSVGSRRRATLSETLELPAWESFPLADRHQLVRTILRAARRQVESRPVSSIPTR